MFCEYCGNQLEDDALFCAKCGKSIKEKMENASEKISLEKQEKCDDSKIPTEKNHPIVKKLCNILSIGFLVMASFFSIGMMMCGIDEEPHASGTFFSVGLNFFFVGILLYEKSNKSKALKVIITIFKIALLILFIITIIGLVFAYTEYADREWLPTSLSGFFTFLAYDGWCY